jgi:hypothetical protein
MKDFGPEEKALKEIRKIRSQQNGNTQGSLPLLSNMTSVIATAFFTMPQERLKYISELLRNLKEIGWDVEEESKAIEDLGTNLKIVVDSLNRIISSQTPDKYQRLEEYMMEYRNLMYTILTIDDLKKHVESMCNNFEISYKKFLGESD